MIDLEGEDEIDEVDQVSSESDQGTVPPFGGSLKSNGSPIPTKGPKPALIRGSISEHHHGSKTFPIYLDLDGDVCILRLRSLESMLN